MAARITRTATAKSRVPDELDGYAGIVEPEDGPEAVAPTSTVMEVECVIDPLASVTVTV
jgi:hypothetical protein